MAQMQEKWMLDDQIRHNKNRTVRLFIILFVIVWAVVFAVGFLIGYPPYVTAPFALIFGLIYLWSASSFSVDMILRSARAKPADPRNPKHKTLMHVVEEMAIASGAPLPKVYVQPSSDINAFATGRKPEEGVICVTEGALDLLDREELQGVIAHELAHIVNHDIKVGTYAVALIGIIAMIAEMVWWSLFFGGGNRDRNVHPIFIVVAIALIIFAPLLSRMTYMAINRQREYLADATGAHMTRNPDGLARALAKIAGKEPEDHHGGDRTVASLYLANPFKRVRKASVFATHPPIDERIERLKRM